jgi:hypothetical protein
LEAQLIITNTSVSANRADGTGGGITDLDGEVGLINTIVESNRADTDADGPDAKVGGGIWLDLYGYAFLKNSMVFHNRRHNAEIIDDCGPNTLESLDYNQLGSSGQCGIDEVAAHDTTVPEDADPHFVDALGGFALIADTAHDLSARDAIPPESCTDPSGKPIALDGTGAARLDGACDIGPYEASARFVPAVVLGSELLRNGGAAGNELGLATNATPYDQYDLAPYWIQPQGEMVQVLYGAADGFPSRAEAPPGAGGYLFAGGINAFSYSYQFTDVHAAAAQIDTGTLRYAASGWFGGVWSDDDSATMQVSFEGEDREPTAVVALGGFDAAARGHQTKLIRDSATGFVPVGTRYLVTIVSMTRANGNYNDGYADELSLVLPEPSAIVTAMTAFGALALLPRSRRRTN